MTPTLVGELINTSRTTIHDAVKQRDADTIRQLAVAQEQAGAHYIDVNAGTGIASEAVDMAWLVETVQSVCDAPLCIDSPSPKVLEAAYDLARRPPMINSISLEKNRLDPMKAFLKGKACGVIALCMDDTGLPGSADAILERAARLVDHLTAIGMPAEHIWIDPLVQPVSTDTGHGKLALEAVTKIVRHLPDVNTICGLSNISFGLPCRRGINRTLVPMLLERGMTGFICDPLDRHLMAAVKTSRMLLGQDDYCLAFMEAAGKGEIPG
ncbi:MAG: dihydropteroate synthase [Desulfobacterales bacterium]|nr:dihydropteroate synthase [Desulfobacterales bacterium]